VLRVSIVSLGTANSLTNHRIK